MANPVKHFAKFAFITSSSDGDPIVGGISIIQGRRYTLTGTRPYIRKNGRSSVVLEWAVDCDRCGESFPFTTGRDAGYMRYNCNTCRDARNAEDKAKVEAEREVSEIPTAPVLHAAIKKLYPHQMSMARNASHERLYAPAVIRKGSMNELSEFTLEEMRQGLQEAERIGWIRWGVVEYNRFRQPVEGYIPRPAEQLEARGLIEAAPSVFD